MSISSLSVRRAVSDDAARIDALYGQLVGDTARCVLPERLQELSEDPRTALLVAEVDGQVCATALVSLCEDVMFKRQPFAVVENVVVDVAARNRGVGAALMREVEAFCAVSDCSKIMLLSSVDRTDAHRFFERCGFDASIKRGLVKYRRAFAC
ncbi:putative N-acetyltransferase YhbS [Variovorax sp. 54]|uniref:GNAT family N-acetyltransferase n=1 Tax=Variovorax sp. 54 TaxID=2035212 RepID=UPI000C1A219D|nr:GNAT family N-acetyltransferase [Variovorax sp. 54]PIF73645.1 putative N-acetyltransferase YhbS [Variovorax sp. 54]